MSAGREKPEEPCSLFSLTQYECAPVADGVRCWPLERIFRKCGRGPAVEVTNALLTEPGDGQTPVVDPKFIKDMPKANNWFDIR